MINLDIRTKLFFLIIANILMFKYLPNSIQIFLAVYFTLCLGIFFSFKRASILFSIYLILTFYELYFINITTFKILDNFLLLTAFLFKAIYLPICAGIMLVGSSKVSEFICILRKIKLPKNIIIVLAVIFRFFPILLADYKNIRNSLKMKGIGISRGYYLLHPLKFFEYIFIPYVVISTNIANDLSISILCRGIDNKNEATSINVLKFKTMDYLFLSICLFIFIFIEVKF